MTKIIQILNRSNVYNISIRANKILRIEKFLGDSQTLVELSYEELPPDVLSELYEIITSNHE